MVSRRTRVAFWIFRRDHPSRPNAMICCFLSSFKTFAMLREATYPPAAVNVLVDSSESMAAFQVFLYGRFWMFTEGPQSTHSLLFLMASVKTEMCQGVHLGPKSHQKSRFSPVSSSDSMTLRRGLSPMTRVQAYGSDACLHHLSNAMLADDPKKEGLSSKVNFAAFSGTPKTMTHCSGGPYKAASAHLSASFLFFDIDARINHPRIFIVGVSLLISSPISPVHCC